MNIAKIQVTGSQVNVLSRDDIPAGIVGATIEIEYTDSIWAGLNKAVVFRGSETAEVLTNQTTVVVPAEAVKTPGAHLRVGIYGTDAEENVVMPTLWANLGVISDSPGTVITTDSALPVWAQLWAMIGNLENLDTNAKSNLVAAVNELAVKTGGTADPEAVQKIVDDYLKANPPKPDLTGVVKSVNGKTPDARGNVEIEVSGGSGEDGFSPVAKVEQTAAGAVITITDKDGTTTATVTNGKDGAAGQPGKDGSDGYTPVKGKDYFDGKDGQDGSPGKDGSDGVSVTHSWNGTVLTVTSASGTSSADLKGEPGKDGSDGKNGSAGADGVSPTVAVSKSGKVTTITITDKDGTKTATINDGSDGQDGKDATATDAVPSYWQTALDNGVEAINTALCEAGCNKSAFLFYSDAHWNWGSQMSPTLLKYLYKHTGMTKTFFGGDIVNDEATDYDTMEYLWDWRNQLKDLPNHHSVVGNHDDGNPTTIFDEKYVYGYLLAAEETSDICRGNSGLYYYVDSPGERTRYLCLDTAYKGVESKQQEFVKGALVSTPDGWHIVAISHIWYNADYTVTPPVISGINSDASTLLSMFESYNSRIGDYADCGGWVEFCIGGHIHSDYDSTSGKGIPIILVETDSKHVRSGLTYGTGTTNESSVNGIIADYDAKKVKVVRIGRGASREVEMKWYEVSYTNVLPLATTNDGTTIYNGIGYKESTRWSSSGNTEQTSDAYAGVYLTGYIPVTAGDVIRLKNITMPNTSENTCKIHMFKTLDDTAELNQSNTSIAENYSGVWDESGNLVEFSIPATSTVKFVRIQCGGITEESIITINEPID